MQIELAPEVALLLETLAVQTSGLEFSGLGFVELRKETSTFYVYDVVPLDVGSTGWTEIPSEKLLPLYERSDVGQLKLWFHRHPVGSGVPGKHNWSGTDERTCRFEPLGVPYGMQDEVKWSISIVRTPKGWVGRYDTYGPKGTTVHIPVVPSFGLEAAEWVADIKAVKEKAAREKARKERRATIENLRQVVPFVDWGDNTYGPRRQRYTTYRQHDMFNDEPDPELDEAQMEQYQAWLEEQEIDEEEDEIGFLASAYYFWDQDE